MDTSRAAWSELYADLALSSLGIAYVLIRLPPESPFEPKHNFVENLLNGWYHS